MEKSEHSTEYPTIEEYSAYILENPSFTEEEQQCLMVLLNLIQNRK